MSEHTKGRLRDKALAFAKIAAAKQFDGRKGHGQSERVIERHMREPELTVLLAAAFEAGAELAHPDLQSDRDELIAALRKLEERTTAFVNAINAGHTPRPEYVQDVRNETAAARALLAKHAPKVKA